MFLNNLREKIVAWFMHHAEGPRAKWILGLISFTESSIFPIPPDPFLIALLMVKKRQWVFYTTLVVITSVLGGLFGYLIGLLFFDFFGAPVVSLYHLEPQLESSRILFNDNAFWAIFTAAFTPVPYKIFTIASGLFQINLIVFIVASILGRGIRYFIIGFLMHLFGDSMAKVFIKYFNIITILAVLAIIFYTLFKIL